MAYAYGPVSHMHDFLTKLIQFASGTAASWSGWTSGGAVPSGQQWTVLTNNIPTSAPVSTGTTTYPVSASATPGDSQSGVNGQCGYVAYLEGPGSSAGDDIIVGIQTYQNSSGAYGFASCGCTEYNAALNWGTMLGASPNVYTALSAGNFSAWFWVSGRRIMACARIAGTDVCFYLGFFLPYRTHNQYPYPLLVSGTVADQTRLPTENSYYQSGIPDPGSFLGVYFRWIDGSWQPIQQYSTYQQRYQVTTFGLYPFMDTTGGQGFDEINDAASYWSEYNLFENFSTTGPQLTNNEVNAYSLFPVIINSPTQLPGQLENFFVVAGTGLNAGDTITDASSQIYDVFHNCWRTEANAFYCIPRI